MTRKISVIIPTCGGKKLTLCLKSIQKQSKTPFEVVIVDNSFGRTADKIVDNLQRRKSLQRLTYIHEPRQGAGYARNTGVQTSQGDLLCYIDDDCIADKDWLLNLTTAYARCPALTVIKGNNDNGDTTMIGRLEYYTDELFFRRKYFLSGNKVESLWLDTKNFLIPRIVFQKYNTYFNSYSMFEDLDFSLQLKQHAIPIVFAPDAVVCHRSNRSFLEHCIREKNKVIYSQLILNKIFKSNSSKNMAVFHMQNNLNKTWKNGRLIRKQLVDQIFTRKNPIKRFMFDMLLVLNDLYIKILSLIPYSILSK